MVGYLRSFETTSLIDTYINNHRMGFHPCNSFFHHNTGTAAMGCPNGSNYYIAGYNGFIQHYGLHYRGKNPAAQIILQTAQTVNRAIKDLYFCPQG
ncbi:hypothetical protein D3C72_1627400 [compost metagenome]